MLADELQIGEPGGALGSLLQTRQPSRAEDIDFTMEIQRIRRVYARRRLENADRVYSRSTPNHVLAVAERVRTLTELIHARGISMTNTNILEAGCGNGAILRQMLPYRADEKRLFGIDLLPEVLGEARKRDPAFNFLCANGGQLPFRDGSFGIILAFTLFTSVLESTIRMAIATELLRVLDSRGVLIWYDFAYNNPANPDVRGIGRREIGWLFPACRIRCKRITLAPPLGRPVARLSPALFHFLSRLRFLSTHYLCLIEKNADSPARDRGSQPRWN